MPWPSNVLIGTPTMLATVSPANITDIAVVLFERWTSDPATTEPTPKNAPWGKPVANRATSASWLEVRGQGGSDVGHRVPGHQPDKHSFAIHRDRQRREHRSTHHHAEGVHGDQLAGLRNGDRQVVGNLGQQPQHQEFAGTDREPTDGESEQRTSHGAEGHGTVTASSPNGMFQSAVMRVP